MVDCAISGYASLGSCLRNRIERIRQLLQFINFLAFVRPTVVT